MLRTTPPLLMLLGVSALCAQSAPELWPGAAYDPKIPTQQQVLGYAPGEKITTHGGILQYFNALAAAAPSRMKVFEYGETWEGRKLVYAALGSETNLRKLAAIKADIQRLADPRITPEGPARELIATLPAVVWLGYGVHGNEISSPDAALFTAYHLLAARNDALTSTVLANVIVLINPVQNPDGRDRFVHSYEQTRGLTPDPNPLAAEHNEPWPTGRPNHYLFDLNRDFLGLTQTEILSEVRALREWLPLVCVDLHEMSGENTYFFTPESDPYNPNLTAAQRQALTLIGKNNARWFDKFGFDYFTREEYDDFYPGYGATWPLFYGALAMTYEQSSTRGLAVRRSDDTLLTFRDAVRHHFVAGISTLESAAEHRAELLAAFYRYRVTAIEEGTRQAVKEYILPRTRDASTTDKLAGILIDHGIEVRRATAAFTAGGKSYAAGTYTVPLAQPAKRLIRTLLDPQTKMDDSFVAAEEARRKLKKPTEIYDVTAWSLPLLFNVEAIAADAVSSGKFEAAQPGRMLPGGLHGGKASVAYLAAWGPQSTARLLASALRENLKIHTSDRSFSQNGSTFPAGSLIFKVTANSATLHDRLIQLARETGAEIYAANSGWVEDGVNFGSRFVVPVKKPAIALAWDAPTQSPSAGAARFVLENQYGYPVTIVRAAQLASADLSKFQVLVLPSAHGYTAVFGDAGAERLQQWVEAGGTLITLGENDLKLLPLAQEDALREDSEKKVDGKAETDKKARVPGTAIGSQSELEKVTRAAAEAPDSVPGAIARVRVRPDYWLTAGAPETVYTMVEGAGIFAPLKGDQGINAAYYDAADKLLVSGHLWSENQKQMAFKPVLVCAPLGRGNVIAFTQDPNFRGISDGMNILFLNAVFRGNSHAK